MVSSYGSPEHGLVRDPLVQELKAHHVEERVRQQLALLLVVAGGGEVVDELPAGVDLTLDKWP